MDERVQRLEGDKDSLQMQVSILMDQIEAQTDKIADLERTLSERAFQLQRAEETLQKVCVFFCTLFLFKRLFYLIPVLDTQELLSRSAAETRQLELLSEISGLKLRYAAMEKENMELRGQLKRSEQDMITLVSQVHIHPSFVQNVVSTTKCLVHLQLCLRHSATLCVELRWVQISTKRFYPLYTERSLYTGF